MKINFNFIKNSPLLKQYSNKLPLIFNQYRLGNYNNAVEGIGSILNQVVIDILTVECVSDKSLEAAKNLEYLKNAGIYPDAIIDDISMIIHGTESVKKENTITEQDFLTQFTSLYDLFAFLVNIYENANVKYWDVQLAYKSSADKNGLFKQREIKNELPVVDVKLDNIDNNLNLDFDSRIVRVAKKTPVKPGKKQA